MKQSTYIYIEEFCTHYNIEVSLVHQLVEYEVLTIETSNDRDVIDIGELPKLEKMVRLHQELDINPQGLHAIHRLLEQVTDLQEEVLTLRRRLNRLED